MRTFSVDEAPLFCRTCQASDMNIPISRKTERCVDCELGFELWIVNRQQFTRDIMESLK